MKETVQLSIGGYAFILEKDAADVLKQYISSLEAHYLSQEGGKEIMEGIEERVAELLLEKCGQGGVVKDIHVHAVIDVIGRPERIEADDPEPNAAPGSGRKKLFRDMENRRLGGVCAGLAVFFGLDVVWMRLIFAVSAAVIFFGGADHGVWSLSVPFLYALLWCAMPAARTAQDRWAMKGDSGSLDDIRRNVASGIREMGDTAREVGRSDFFQRFGRLFLVLIGLVLLITGTSGLASVSVLSFKGVNLFGVQLMEGLEELEAQFPALYDLMSEPWFVVLAVLAVVLPLVGMLYAGIQLIFGFKSPSWRPGLVLFVLWLIIVIVLLVVLMAGGVSAGYALPVTV